MSTEGAVDPSKLPPVEVKDPFPEERPPEEIIQTVHHDADNQGSTAQALAGTTTQDSAVDAGKHARIGDGANVAGDGKGDEVVQVGGQKEEASAVSLQSFFTGTVNKFLAGSGSSKEVSGGVQEKEGGDAGDDDVAVTTDGTKDQGSGLTKGTGFFAGLASASKSSIENNATGGTQEKPGRVDRVKDDLKKLAEPFTKLNLGKMVGGLSISKGGSGNTTSGGGGRNQGLRKGLRDGVGVGLGKLTNLQNKVLKKQNLLVSDAKSAAAKRLARHVNKGKVNQVTVAVVKAIVVIASFYEAVFEGASKLGFNEVQKCVYGLLLMFCGGKLPLTIAVCEVSLQSGVERIQYNAKLLKRQFEIVSRASERDNLEDLNNDNIPDVLQISLDELFERKVLLFLRTCDPDIMHRLLSALCYVVMAAIAAIQDRRIHAVVLGAALADVLIQKFLSPPSLKKQRGQSPDEARIEEWQRLMLIYVLRLVCICAALKYTTVYYRVYYAIKGATLMSKGLTELAERNGHYELCDGYADEVFSGCLAVIGLYSQFKGEGDISMAVNVFFFPLFVFIEPALTFALAVESL